MQLGFWNVTCSRARKGTRYHLLSHVCLTGAEKKGERESSQRSLRCHLVPFWFVTVAVAPLIVPIPFCTLIETL
jgi:hypothetical protein